MNIFFVLSSGIAAALAVIALAQLVCTGRTAAGLRVWLLRVVEPGRDYLRGRPVERRLRLWMGGFAMTAAFATGAAAIDPVAGALLAAATPICAVRLRGLILDRRRSRLDRQLGDVATSMANALASGHAIRQAVAGAAREVDEPARAELRRAASELALGMPTDRALDGIAARSGSSRFAVLVAATDIQRSAGGNLAVLLREMARHESDRVRLEREAESASAQARFTGKVVVAMPIAAAGILEFIDPGFIGSLLASFLGAWLVAAAVVLQVVGGLAIARISRASVR